MDFIFDFGNVLVDFKPVEYLSKLFTDKSVVEKMHNLIFKSPEWLIMDRGQLTHNEAIKIFCTREPDYQAQIHITMKNANGILSRINETIELLPKIRDFGYRLYYLSNMQRELRDYLLDKHEYIHLFNGGIFSCDVNSIKPSPEIYRHLINKYNLIPEECIFFDDVEENISAAEKEGMKGVLFIDAKCVLNYL